MRRVSSFFGFVLSAAECYYDNMSQLRKRTDELINRGYEYLQPKEGGSNYRQFFVNGRIRAEVLYRETIGQEPLTPAEVAQEYNVPVKAVIEAIDYCTKNEALLNVPLT